MVCVQACPDRTRSQSASTPIPAGVMHPIPVITMRFIFYLLSSNRLQDHRCVKSSKAARIGKNDIAIPGTSLVGNVIKIAERVWLLIIDSGMDKTTLETQCTSSDFNRACGRER